MTSNQEFQANKDAITRRVQKLLAIAQDSRANPHEAAAAAKQAENIMRKFQIDHADLIAREIKNDPSQMTTAETRADAITNGTKAKTIPPWASILAAAVADLAEVGATTHDSAELGKCIKFYGYKPDVELAVWIMQYLIGTINALAFEYRKTDDYKINGRTVLSDYRKGCSTAIVGKIREFVRQREDEKKTMSQGRELMVVKADAIVAKWGGAVVARVTRRRFATRNEEAWHEGRRAGQKVDIHRRGIEGGASTSNTLKLN